MNIMGMVMFVSFLLSMVLFITAEVFAIVKIKRKECTAVRAFIWFEVLGFLSVLPDHYRLYDKGSDRLKDCEKNWWYSLSVHAKNNILDPYDVCNVIKEKGSFYAVKRYLFVATLEKISRIVGLFFYILFLIIDLYYHNLGRWVWGSILIALWNMYKLYYVYGVFRPLVRLKVCSSHENSTS